ncbi:hypothetical protein [Ornithinibacillus halotolerans]|uniref:DUF4367 domain-containing protein n=1 Tax=Ornithinibacillus halotolerans TaxID=1274357 RepID=A0A916S9E8_9BACI|nr:hypothetical protein [Ornithinibacillus halotolerans]GGA89770.1 hypothetical protein GCM10008025_35470 [Ornithinibacillus halotolerans]
MNKDSIERKLETMPQTKLSHEKKDKMLQTIIQQRESKQPQGKKNWFGWLAPIGGTIVVAMLVWIIVIPNFDTTTPQAEYVAEEELASIQKLWKFSGMIQLPTYAPFTVGEVYYQELFVNGIDDILEAKAEFLLPQITYFSSDNPDNKLMTVYLTSTDHDHLYEDIGEGEYNEIVEFENGLQAEYYTPSNEVSHFSWIEEGYHITITTLSPEDNPISLEEIIKVAESFKLYEITDEEKKF